MVWNLSTAIETMVLSKFQTTQCETNTQFEVCCCNDLTLTAHKHLLNNESEMCVGRTADSPLNIHHCQEKGHMSYQKSMDKHVIIP